MLYFETYKKTEFYTKYLTKGYNCSSSNRETRINYIAISLIVGDEHTMNHEPKQAMK